MKLDSKTLWNEAGRVGFVFGGFSSLCLLLKEGAALTGSTFLVQAAAIILWAVEFFGCILLMKKYMLDLRDKFDGVTVVDTYRFGRRVALIAYKYNHFIWISRHSGPVLRRHSGLDPESKKSGPPRG